MSAQQFLDNAIGKVSEVFFGADYPYDTPEDKIKAQRGASKSGQSRNVFDTIKDKIKSMPGSQPAKPNPYAAKPTGQLTQKPNGVLNTVRRGAAAASAANPYALAGTAIVSDITSRGVADGTLKGKPGVPTKPVGPIQPRIERKPGPWDEGYEKPNTTMEPTERATLSEYLNPGARQETREIPTGGTQDGLKMSGGVSAAFVPEYANSSFNQLLAGVNTSGYQPFSSNQLPTSAASPDSKMSPMTQAITNIGPVADGQEYANNLGRQGTKGIGPVADGQVYGNALENSPGAGTKGIGPLADGGAYARALGKGDGSTSRLDAALSDTAGMQSYMSKFSSGDQERLANRAFLDTKGSMEGLRAKEAVNGVVYAGGQHYIDGGEGNPAQRLKDPQNARDIASGKSKAQDFLAKKTADTVAAVKQSPSVLEDGAKNGAFQQDKPMFSGSTPAIEGAVEFDNNNSGTLPTFGAPKGYKRQGTKIDTSMTNPFGY